MKNINDERFLTAVEIAARYSVRRETLYKWIKSQGFPRPKKFGSASRWKLSELSKWENSRSDF